ncbi:FimB/Mfa2 family fimbrial subunit [Parabacteroides sp.]
MNRTLTYLLLAGLSLAGCLTGCIREDFSDCPPKVIPPDPPVIEETDGVVKLDLSYTMHNRNVNGQPVDRFGKEVGKVDVFVFDENGAFIKQVSQQAKTAFPENYEQTLVLKEGGYRFVVWGNHYEHETAHNLAPGMPIEQARMNFIDAAQGKMPLQMDSLFFGKYDETVVVKANEEQVIPINLMKDRKDIRLLIRWREKETKARADSPGFCEHPEHAERLTASIVDYHGGYDFDNNLVEGGDSLVYLPGDLQAPAYDETFYNLDSVSAAEIEKYAYVADFTKHRLMSDCRGNLCLHYADSLVYRRPLLDLIRRIDAYATQEALDREDHFLIEFLFECSHDDDDDKDDDDDDEEEDPTPPDPQPEEGWTLVSITINGWNLVEKDVEL